ncbi:MAG: hypothetical protein AB1758_07385, partial [Candidatus Eremiobacterota bacterium]
MAGLHGRGVSELEEAALSNPLGLALSAGLEGLGASVEASLAAARGGASLRTRNGRLLGILACLTGLAHPDPVVAGVDCVVKLMRDAELRVLVNRAEMLRSGLAVLQGIALARGEDLDTRLAERGLSSAEAWQAEV